jgi:nitrate/TMAO reductase-like tetraheme cytochrome c subunit
MSEERDAPPAETRAAAEPKIPSLLNNYVSFTGLIVAAAGFVSVALMLLLEFLGGERAEHNPYAGIFTYILFPSVMVFGLFIALAGIIWERRRRHRMKPEEIGRYPIIDLNDPRRRRNFVALLLIGFVFLFLSAFGSYRAFEHTESVAFCGQTCHTVMKPELTAYLVSPHARVKCVECHVGPGAGWYVKSKLNGAYQLYSVAFNKYSRPIKSPVHNLRPAQQTCEHCHWPAKFFGGQLKVFNRFAYDEANTLRQTRMLINVGGGDPAAGQVAGIHWHMNIANEITYASTDDQRQVIPWVRFKDRQGNVTEYKARDSKLTPEEIARLPQRQMDCVDCHNRPTHVYVPPDQSVNDSLGAGKLDPQLPYLKREAVALLSKSYATTDEALRAIAEGLEGFYRSNYPEVYAGKGDSVRAAVGEVQRLFQTYTFPEMKTDWQSHPNNVGHFYFQGCFRCHNGELVSDTGRVIRKDCRICHTTLDQTEGGVTTAAPDGAFRHPVALGTQGEFECAACHKGDRGFQHPVNLGDLSQFQCTDCHAGKVWAVSR